MFFLCNVYREEEREANRRHPVRCVGFPISEVVHKGEGCGSMSGQGVLGVVDLTAHVGTV